MAGKVALGCLTHQETMRDKISLGSKEPSELLVSLVWCCCLKDVWTSLDPHCPCRGSSSAEPGMNSFLLGGLEGDHRPEFWADGKGHDSPHREDGSCNLEVVWGKDYDVILKKAKMW